MEWRTTTEALLLMKKNALVYEVFCHGNLEAGADIHEADCCDGHNRRLLPDETAELHKLLLFAFWAFDKKPPKFVSCSKPENQQFDNSTAASTVPVKEGMHASDDSEVLAKAVATLAPSEQK